MPSIVVYYKPQPDPETFEKRYLEEHLPMADAWSGVTEKSFQKVTNSIAGAFPYSHVFVAHFGSQDDLNAMLASDEMKKAVAHATEIAPNGFDAVMVDQIG